MPQLINLKKGFDIKLAGKASKNIGNANQPETFAFKPTDFYGLERPKLLVNVGDNVKAGTPILFDKAHEGINFVAPVSGEVIEIIRGEKRKLLEIKILADSQVEYESFKKYSVTEITNLRRKEAIDNLTNSGVWPKIVQRPYGTLADPSVHPKAIFISAFDSHPLAPDYDFIFDGEEHHFQTGLNILKKLAQGATIHLNINVDSEFSKIFAQAEGVQLNKFKGPHPAGNVGVQIHHLNPINKGEIVWTINPYGVIQIGKLFTNGVYDSSKIIAVSGSEIATPQYYKTHEGACVDKFLENNLKNDHVRVVSGNVLTGQRVEKNGYLGYFDHLVSVIPEGDYYEMFGWIKPTFKKLSFHRAIGLLSFLNKSKEYALDTNMRGEPRPFVQTGIFEQVIPMDILPTYLLKAIMAEDYDDMEALGIYEVIEEDLALCEFVDVSKHNVQDILREGLDLIKNG